MPDTLISTQGMALAATECRREGEGVGGAGAGSSPGEARWEERRSSTVATRSQLLDLCTDTCRQCLSMLAILYSTQRRYLLPLPPFMKHLLVLSHLKNLHYACMHVKINRCLNKGKGSMVNNLFILNLILFLQSFSVNNLLKL